MDDTEPQKAPTRSSTQQEKISRILSFLQAESTLVLSTVGSDGAVHSAPLFYSVDESLRLAWISSPNSTHSQSLLIQPRSSIAVFRSTFQWQQIVGVQMHGVCSTVEGPDRSPILDAYCSRFNLGAAFSLLISTSRVFLFKPGWVRYLDNQKRLGYKFEIVL